MKTIKGDITKINQIDDLEKSVVVIGNFDGIHIYHQKLIRIAEKTALHDNLSLILVTFDQSFKDYFQKTDTKILPNEAKEALIGEHFQVDYYVELKVNKNITEYNKMMFMDWLKNVLKVQKIVEGSDFTFGQNKEGTVKDLQTFFGKKNVIILKRKKRVSSTKIRQFLQKGKKKSAEKYLLIPLKKSS